MPARTRPRGAPGALELSTPRHRRHGDGSRARAPRSSDRVLHRQESCAAAAIGVTTYLRVVPHLGDARADRRDPLPPACALPQETRANDLQAVLVGASAVSVRTVVRRRTDIALPGVVPQGAGIPQEAQLQQSEQSQNLSETEAQRAAGGSPVGQERAVRGQLRQDSDGPRQCCPDQEHLQCRRRERCGGKGVRREESCRGDSFRKGQQLDWRFLLEVGYRCVRR